MLAGLDGDVLGVQAEGVVAHRVQHAQPLMAAEAGDDVPHGVVLHVPHVGAARGVGEHLEDVRGPAGPPGHDFVVGGVLDHERLLAVPDLLPLGLDRLGSIGSCHPDQVLSPSSRARRPRGLPGVGTSHSRECAGSRPPAEDVLRTPSAASAAAATSAPDHPEDVQPDAYDQSAGGHQTRPVCPASASAPRPASDRISRQKPRWRSSSGTSGSSATVARRKPNFSS